jgi:hypothetical protein
MSSWLRGLLTRTKNFDMLRSIWFANLDCMVGITQYLQDDSDEPKQCGKSCKSNQSTESKQCGEPSHNCANHSTRTCNCTGHDCIDNDGNTSYFGSHSKKRYTWNDICTKPRYKYYDDAGYRESTRSTQG